VKLVLALSTVILSSCFEERRTSMVYRLPDTFYGEALVQFGDPVCEPLPRVDGKWIVTFSRTGTACTLTPIEYGWGHDEWLRTSESGVTRPVVDTGDIRGGSVGGCCRADKVCFPVESFFVQVQPMVTAGERCQRLRSGG